MKEIEFLKPRSPERIIPPGPVWLPDGPVEVAEVTLDLKKIDEVWKRDPFEYSGKNGPDRKEAKIKNIENDVVSSGKVYMPIIFLSGGDPNDLKFANGRHTTAYLFENGYEKAQFIVPEIQRDTILESFS